MNENVKPNWRSPTELAFFELGKVLSTSYGVDLSDLQYRVKAAFVAMKVSGHQTIQAIDEDRWSKYFVDYIFMYHVRLYSNYSYSD